MVQSFLFPSQQDTGMVRSSTCFRFTSQVSFWMVAFGVVGFFVAVPVQGQQKNLPPQVEKINKAMQQGWEENGLKPSPAEDELKWCRRVYLDLIGRIPSFEELADFSKDKTPSKKLNLVNRLIHDDRYTEEYANHWAMVWTQRWDGRPNVDQSGRDDEVPSRLLCLQ
jgi:hypothetical protein